MESNKLQILDRELPLRGYIDDGTVDKALSTVFKAWVAVLLDIKADNEDKLDNALHGVKKHFWSMGFKEIKKAFTMYADSELITVPIPNYISRILVGQIFKEYKQQKVKAIPVIEPVVISEEEKRDNEILSATYCYDDYIQNGYLNDTSLYLYTVLLDRFKFTEKEKNVMIELSRELEKPVEDQRIHYKKQCLRRYFDRLHAKGWHLKDEI